MFGQKRVGIMGTGSIAGTMAKTIRGMKGVTLYAVGSRTLEKAQAFAKENKAKVAYGSYEELCKDPKIDFIYVATPHSEHYANTCLALENGKSVLCEKAFALNEKQAAAMFKLAAEKDLLLTEAMWTRFIPLGKKLKDIISSNKIGDVQMVTADLSFNIAWRQRIHEASLGGGALLDLGVYGLNFATMVLGDDVTDISSVAVTNDSGVDMQDSITLKYRTGQLAVITCSAVSSGCNKGMIFGSNGHIEVEDINNFSSITVYNNAGEKEGYYKREKQITGYEYEVMSVINSLNENWKECPEMPSAQTIKIMNMMDFIRGQIGVKFAADDEAFEKIETKEADAEEIEAKETEVEETEAKETETVEASDDATVEADVETDEVDTETDKETEE
ncbi:MAG: Gfo/Idh/MocA family oxidoreductase [Butyrivibrio sp.]|nr:Gfo/Idh/MocA family oxidoreductase [Butyrivibrio sp.]